MWKEHFQHKQACASLAWDVLIRPRCSRITCVMEQFLSPNLECFSTLNSTLCWKYGSETGYVCQCLEFSVAFILTLPFQTSTCFSGV